MITFMLRNLEFSRDNEEDMEILITEIFSSCTNRAELYAAISENTFGFIQSSVAEGRGISEEKVIALMTAMRIMYEVYGRIYDPHQVYFKMRPIPEIPVPA